MPVFQPPTLSQLQKLAPSPVQGLSLGTGGGRPRTRFASFHGTKLAHPRAGRLGEVFRASKANLRRLFAVAFVFTLVLISCESRRSHLIQVVSEEIEDPNTITLSDTHNDVRFDFEPQTHLKLSDLDHPESVDGRHINYRVRMSRTGDLSSPMQGHCVGGENSEDLNFYLARGQQTDVQERNPVILL